jgi:hypothetical protein
VNRSSGSEVQVVVEQTQDGPASKKVYLPPRLVRYGDVRDVTLGISGGTGESGAPGAFRVF